MNDKSSLFRPEILAAQRSQGMGSIQINQSIPARAVTGISLALGVGLLVFVLIGNIARKSTVGGVVVPSGGTITVTAIQTGTLVRSFVVEGTRVKQGAKLFEISTERLSNMGEISELIEKQLNQRKIALDSDRRARRAQILEKKQTLQARIKSMVSEAKQLSDEINIEHYRQNLAEKTLQKFQSLHKSGFLSEAQIRQREEELLETRARVSSLQRTRMQLEAAKLNVALELRNLDTALATELAMLDKEAAELQQELVETQARRSLIVTAPQNGIVSTITYQPGQFLNASQPLATIITEQKFTDSVENVDVHLYAPSRTAGFIAPGQLVMLRFDAFPYQKFGLQHGMVISVSRTPFAPSELPANLASTILSNEQRLSGGANEGLYRIKVKLIKQSISAYGQNHVLIPGMTVSGDIIQERRKIWEWIAEPALAVGKRL